ncbi:MAG: hypothetical protein EP329_02665 [Deltaproteobacteria bacterium]|nr:MAG: hypothetical protein EP329_02665 [Deltaproteobacteria bacterium]
MTLGLLAALVVAVATGGAAHAATGPEPSGARFGSELRFHGWSKDSEYIAYSRARHRPGVGRKAKPIDDVQRMHRHVTDGKFDGFGKMVGGDVETWALDRGYVVDPAPRTRSDARTTAFRVAGREYTLTLLVGQRVGWELRAEGRLLTRRTFDTIYLDYAAELYVAPNARQAVLVMHLDAGWVVDAAIYPVKLLPAAPEDRAASSGTGGE